MWALEVLLTNCIFLKLQCSTVRLATIYSSHGQFCWFAFSFNCLLCKSMQNWLSWWPVISQVDTWNIFPALFFDIWAFCMFVCVCVYILRYPFLHRWGSVAMLCTWRYCTCPGLCRNEEIEATCILSHVLMSRILSGLNPVLRWFDDTVITKGHTSKCLFVIKLVTNKVFPHILSQKSLSFTCCVFWAIAYEGFSWYVLERLSLNLAILVFVFSDVIKWSVSLKYIYSIWL